MRKVLLVFTALIGFMLTVGAQTPYERIIGTQTDNLRKLNRQSHFPKSGRAVTKAANPLYADEKPANAIEAPFSHDLGKNSDVVDIVKQYTFIDANNDSRSWKIATMNSYSACMPPKDEGVEESDDWLVSVPVHMTAGDYIVSFDLGYMGSGATGVRLGVNIGTAPTVEGMTTEIVPPTVFGTRDQTKYQYNCKITEEGYYYIGVHNTTTKAMNGTVRLFNLSVESGSVEPSVPTDPPAAGTLTWTLAPKGELKADLTYTAPTKTKAGEELTEITKVEITSRWGEDVFTYDNVKPGETIEVKDVAMNAGSNNCITAVAYTGETAGEKVEHRNIFCGPDAPLAPQNVRLTVSADFKSAVLSWDAVGETGKNGGYVNPDEVTYYIFDAFGSYYDPAIATTGDTSIKLEYPDLKGQDFVAYQVTAGYGENYSDYTNSAIVTIGEPDKLPYTESFADSHFKNIWLIDPQSDNENQMAGTIDDSYFPSIIDPDDPEAPVPLTSQDGDNGFFYWLPYEKDVMYGMISARIDISAAANPALEFWYQGQGSALDVLVSADDAPFEAVRTIDLQKTPTKEGWTLATVPLNAYKDAKAIQIELRLRAIHNTDGTTWSVPLDNIRIRDVVDKDLRLVAVDVPDNVKPGDKIEMKARVENIGSDITEGHIEWTVNGRKAGTAPLPEMRQNAFADVSFGYDVPLNARETLLVAATAVLEGDGCAENNTAEKTVGVKLNDYPTVTDLTYTLSETGTEVSLSWSAPSLDGITDAKTVSEDFENPDYTPMSITGAGKWTVYDGDGQATYNIFRETYNPYQTQPMAFQLFNRTVAQVPEMYWKDAEPHSGETFMMAPSCQANNNDNRLISPELSGNAQTVSFWAKSCMITWGESFEVAYSTTGNAPEDFTHTVAVENYPADGIIPEVWTEYKVALPEGARYFAILHKTYDTLALLVDDVTYEAAPDVPQDISLTGYHVFRNDVQLTDEPLKETTYTDRPQTDSSAEGGQEFTYTVVPVYNYGPAPASNSVTVSVSTDINSIKGDGTTATYYNINGVRVSGRNLTPGIYVRVKDGKASKIAVR